MTSSDSHPLGPGARLRRALAVLSLLTTVGLAVYWDLTSPHVSSGNQGLVTVLALVYGAIVGAFLLVAVSRGGTLSLEGLGFFMGLQGLLTFVIYLDLVSGKVSQQLQGYPSLAAGVVIFFATVLGLPAMLEKSS